MFHMLATHTPSQIHQSAFLLQWEQPTRRSTICFVVFFSWGRIYFFSVNNKKHTLAVKYMCTVYYCERSHFLCLGADWKHTQPVISVLHLSAICWLQSVTQEPNTHVCLQLFFLTPSQLISIANIYTQYKSLARLQTLNLFNTKCG